MFILRVENLTLDVPGRRLLADVNFELAPGESLALMGPSGSGKTSLLNCLAGIRPPTSGRVWVCDEELSHLSPSRRAAIRLSRIGYVFQFGELLPELNVIENTALPLRLAGRNWDESESIGMERLREVGLAESAQQHPSQLSGGEIQRVALARALAMSPSLLIADEPTGALDEETGGRVCQMMIELCAHHSAALVVATHNPRVARSAAKHCLIQNGQLQEIAVKAGMT